MNKNQLPHMETALNVTVMVSAEICTRRRTVRELLSLSPGSVIEIDWNVDAPVVVLVNGQPLARGEIVVTDKKLGVQITDFEPRSNA